MPPPPPPSLSFPHAWLADANNGNEIDSLAVVSQRQSENRTPYRFGFNRGRLMESK